MTPYHTCLVQCRDQKHPGERRNVGLLVVSPTLGKAWLRRADLRQRASLLGDDAAFVRALLDGVEEEAGALARERSPARVHGWMRSRSLPTEDTLTLAQPGMGFCEDVDAEVRRLRELYLGTAPSLGRSEAEKVREAVLRFHALRAAFQPREFASGPATWRFDAVASRGGRPIVLSALKFDQRKPEGVLDAAFKNVGRAGEVRLVEPGVQWVTIAAGPLSGVTGSAFRRACAVMSEGGLNVVPADATAVERALRDVGLLATSGVAEA